MDGLARAQSVVPYAAGTRRMVPAQTTLARVLPHTAACGITRVANITGLDVLGIPVFVAHRPNSRSLSVSQGKGLTAADAKISAVMESIEAFHAEHIMAPLRFASVEQLGAAAVVDPRHLARAKGKLLSAAQPIFWIEGEQLGTGATRFLPYELVHLNYTLPHLPGSGFFVASSNGLASGNHHLEAVSHGLCEAIERDAATLWALSGDLAHECRVDLDSVEDGSVRALLNLFAQADVAVAIWDTTSDVGVASFVAMVMDRVPHALRPLPPARGMGCHPSREVALCRALTEAAQSRLTGIAGSRDDIGELRLRKLLDPAQQRRSHAMIIERVGRRRFEHVPSQCSTTVDDDVAWLQSRLHRVGLDRIFVVDLLKPEFGIPVVRVIVPGLEALFDMPLFQPGTRATRVQERRSA